MIDLNIIYSVRKRKEILNILNTSEATHYQRCYLVGFLKYAVGLSAEDILNIIAKYNHWNDYDPAITKYQVMSIRKNRELIHNTDDEPITDDEREEFKEFVKKQKERIAKERSIYERNGKPAEIFKVYENIL